MLKKIKENVFQNLDILYDRFDEEKTLKFTADHVEKISKSKEKIV